MTMNSITNSAIKTSLLAILLASSTVYDKNSNNNCYVLGFVSPPVVYLARTFNTNSNTNNCITSYSSVVPLNYAPDESDEGNNFSRVTGVGAGAGAVKPARQKQQEQEQQQLQLEELKERFTSPVLKLHCGEILEWKERYGHPNIPLKNDGGNACQTLRRLHVQQQLTDVEVEWLESINFRFHSIEDVYRFADFDEMLDRLLEYEKSRPNNNFQIPKKCPEDPELGAWVTGIRRLDKDGVNPEHERRLSEVNFAWKSTRKCGSKFMMQFRDWTKQVELEGVEVVLEDPKTTVWIIAQQQALKRGNLSQTRVQYMGQLFGERWTTIGKEAVRK